MLALGSKFAIRAAQDEIEELRSKYIIMYPPNKEDRPLPYYIEFWMNIIDLRWNRKREQYNDVEQLGERGSIFLPGLTGLRNFHLLGHVMPKAVPIILLLLWAFLLANVKRDIPHLLHKHWSTYLAVIVGILLLVWLIPNAAKYFKNRSSHKDGRKIR